jgi:diguanylate cyclase (GGDEF)-like protein/PAS domain S-box-containing protein
VQAINSTVEILLIGNNQADIVQIDYLLTQVKFDSLQVTRVKDPDSILNFSQKYHPDLIFFVIDPRDSGKSIAALSRVQQAYAPNVPLILFSRKANIDLKSLPVVFDDWFILSEAFPNLLEKTITFALKISKLNHQLEYIKQESSQLDSQLTTTKNLFQTIVDSSSTLIWMCDDMGHSTFFNQAWSRVLGKINEPKSTKLSGSWMINIHPQDLAECEQTFNQALAKNQGFTTSYRLKKYDHNYYWISNYAVPQFYLSGEFKGLVGYCFDITSYKETEQKLIQRAASDRLLAQITQRIHASLDLDQILQTTVEEVKQFLQAEKIQINRVDEKVNLTLLFESRLVGCALSCDISESRQVPATLFHHNLAQLSAGKIATKHFSDSEPTVVNACSTLLIPIICETKLWGLICIENYSIAREWTSEETNLLERVAMELSVAIKQAKLYQQLEQANQELEQLSVIDGLTKIANRRKFDQHLKAEWSRLAREQSPLSLILCDIDHFKLYNDTYGHQAGDRCLRKVAQAISKVVKRPADLVARYGGEEFVLVLPGTPVKGALYLAQQIRWQIKALKIPHLNSPLDLYLTLSLGVSCCIPRANLDFSVLVEAADRGLYQAKAAGRDRAVEYEI